MRSDHQHHIIESWAGLLVCLSTMFFFKFKLFRCGVEEFLTLWRCFVHTFNGFFLINFRKLVLGFFCYQTMKFNYLLSLNVLKKESGCFILSLENGERSNGNISLDWSMDTVVTYNILKLYFCLCVVRWSYKRFS